MDSHILPNEPSATRSPGERPDWCLNTNPEDSGTDNRSGAAVFSWCRSFGTQSLGVELVAEDHLTENGGTAGNARVHAYSPEGRAMSLTEAEQLALLLIDAVKITRDTQNKPANRF